MSTAGSRDRPAAAAFSGDLDDRGLVDGITRRDRGALETAYLQHGSRVHALARGLCGESHADDLTELVFLELWHDPAGYEPALGSLRSHLLMQVQGKAVLVLRSRAQDPIDARPGAVDVTDAGSIISVLPDEERHAIVLTYFGGHTCSEVARLLGIPQGTIRSRLRSGLARLQSQRAAAAEAALQPATTQKAHR